MRRRSTFFHGPSVDISPSQLQLSGDRFFITDLKSSREERLILSLEELPQELQQVLKHAHELHIRWATENDHNTTTPLYSRISPGLHVSYTPLNEQNEELLCSLLRTILSKDLKCLSPRESFTTTPLVSDRFAMTPSLHYYSRLPSLSRLIAYFQTQLCSHADPDAEKACIHSTSLLSMATTLDVSYDSISHTLVFTASWSAPPQVYFDPIAGDVYYDAWQAKIDTATASKVEVGILTESKATDPHELALSGVLAVLGEDDMPKATMFSFPSRHHAPLPRQSYSVSFTHPTGLHPTMRLSFPDSSGLIPPPNKPADSTCALHSYLTLPSALFPDPYQLSTTDPLFLASHNLIALRSIAGELDLEAPDYVLSKWGSNVLLELATPSSSLSSVPKSNPWTVTIPLHLRYLSPSNTSAQRISIPWPVVFWACTAEEGTKFPVNPFDRVNLGYDGLFGPRTMFFHLDPNAATGVKLVETLDVPVLNLQAAGARWIETGTVAVVLVGWAWVVWYVLRALGIVGKGNAKVAVAAKKKD